MVTYEKKRSILPSSKVLTKVKTAINNHLLVRSSRKRHDPARDDHLLDSSLNETQELAENAAASVSALTTLEIRMNEGKRSSLGYPSERC